MIPADLKALRAELKCTAKELGSVLGLDQATVLKWEAGDLFPTKKYVERLVALREQGPGAVPRKVRGASPPPLQLLADPAMWEIFRKLLAHKKFRDEVTKLAVTYGDPNEGNSTG